MEAKAATLAKYDRWFDRALAILEGRTNGMGMPVIESRAIRGYPPAMMYLAARLLDPDDGMFDPVRGLRLERRAARRDWQSWWVQNLSTSYRNLGDMQGYRYWLRRAERLGDPDVARERRGFRTRFPYEVMRRWERYRPYRAVVDNPQM